MSLTKNKILLILLTGAAFGSSIVMARFALREIDPYTQVVLRFGIASIFYAIAFLILKRGVPTDRRKITNISLVGFAATGLPLLLFLIALNYISSGMFAILFAAMPLCTGVIANFFLGDEKLNKRLVVGLLISLCGAVYLIASKTNGLAETFNIKGPLITLAGIIMLSSGSVYARSRLKNEDPFVVSSMQTLAAFVLLSIIIISLGKFHIDSVSLKAWAATIYTALIGSFLAFWLTFTLIKRYGATASALPGYIIPVVSSILGAILLSEVLSFSLLIGAMIIFLGILFSTKYSGSYRKAKL